MQKYFNLIPALFVIFVMLHKPNGDAIYINIEKITYIGAPYSREYSFNAETKLRVDGQFLSVTESPQQVLDKINQLQQH